MKNIKGISLKNNTGIEYSSDNAQLLERISRILMTNQGERVNNFNFGSLISNYLFEVPNILLQTLEKEVIDRITMYEPAVTVSNVDINIENDIANIKIYLIKKENFEELTLDAALAL